MKKIIAIILSFVLILALSACVSKPQNGLSPNGENVKGSESGKQIDLPSENEGGASVLPDSSKDGKSNPPSAENRLSRDEAIKKALDKAGLRRADVRDLEAELDRDRGGIFWEVSFEAADKEYEFDINAESGEIVKVEREKED